MPSFSTEDLLPSASAEDSMKPIAACSEIDLFLSIFNIMEDFVFGNATYILNIIYLLNLGKTSSLTVKEDVSLPQNC